MTFHEQGISKSCWDAKHCLLFLIMWKEKHSVSTSSSVAIQTFAVLRPASWKMVVLLLNLEFADCARGQQCYFHTENNLFQRAMEYVYVRSISYLESLKRRWNSTTEVIISVQFKLPALALW